MVYYFTVILQLLFKLNRPIEVASRGYSFIISFSKSLALHEVFDSVLFISFHICVLLNYFSLNCIFLLLFVPFWLLYDVTSQRILPFCMREVWVITACLALIEATTSNYRDGLVAPDVEKEFFRLLGDLFSLTRVKVGCLSHEVNK